MNIVKALFFDIDRTLLDEDQAFKFGMDAFFDAYNGRLGMSRPHFDKLWRSLHEKHMQRYLTGELNFQGQRRERIRELFGAPGLGLSEIEADSIFQTFLGAYEGNWRMFPDVSPCLQAVDGLSLGVITNGDPRQQRLKLERLGVAQVFPVVITPREVGYAKPAPEIFLQACARVGLPPDSCAYVGDSLEIDALASQRAGLQGVWLNREGLSSVIQGVRMVTSLLELPTVLR